MVMMPKDVCPLFGKKAFFVAYNSCTNNNVVANVSSRHFQGVLFFFLLVTPWRMISTVNKN
jgi:hypothetical protein